MPPFLHDRWCLEEAVRAEEKKEEKDAVWKMRYDGSRHI